MIVKKWLNALVESLLSKTYDLSFTHPEVVVDSKKVFKLSRNPTFIQKVKAIVVDEVRLAIPLVGSRGFRAYCSLRNETKGNPISNAVPLWVIIVIFC